MIVKTVLVVFAIIRLIFLFLLFYKPQLKIDFQVTNVASDTIFKNPVGNVNDSYGRTIALRAISELDSSTEIFIRESKYTDTLFLPKPKLPKGKFDTTWKSEYYAQKAKVAYLRKGAKSGNFKLIFRLLTPNHDTIAQLSDSPIYSRLSHK